MTVKADSFVMYADASLARRTAILVIGGSGTVGTEVINNLIDNKHHVVNIDVDLPNVYTEGYDFPTYIVDRNETTLIQNIDHVCVKHNIVSTIIIVDNVMLEEADAKDLTQIDVNLFRDNLDHSLVKSFIVAKHVLPSLRKNGGAITFTSSVDTYKGVNSFSHSTAKAGLEQLTQNIVAEEVQHGVRANIIVLNTKVNPVEAAKVLCDITTVLTGITGHTIVLNEQRTIA